jgi:IclR family pca regulon transcriptional regulator
MPARAAETIDRKDLIEGLGKGLRVIEAFDDDHPRLTASEAGALAGITRTAARRHLLSLVHFGYASSDGKQFWLAPRVLRLGQSYLGAARLPRLVQPFIQRVSMQCGETVNVSVLDGHEVVYVARSSPPRWVSIGYQVGVRVPAHVVTPGAVMLAALDDAALATRIDAHDFVGFRNLLAFAMRYGVMDVQAACELGMASGLSLLS